jgi:hypothetical protein
MALSLVDVASDTATVTLQVRANTLAITYYPSKITEKVFAQLQRFGSLNRDQILDGFAALNELLVQLIKSWDFYEDAEQTVMVPLETDRLADVPLFLRVGVINAIMGDIRPETIATQMIA